MLVSLRVSAWREASSREVTCSGTGLLRGSWLANSKGQAAAEGWHPRHSPQRRCIWRHSRIVTRAPAATPPAVDQATSSSSSAAEKEEPEAALILLACGIGLTTGASIVLFNDAIHVIRDAIWQHGSLLSSTSSLRNISESELWPKVVFPPMLGGAVVAALGLLMGGYTDPPSKKQASSAASSSSASRNGTGSSNGSVDSAADGTTGNANVERLRSILRPVARAVAATVTLGTGASLGPEGPSVDIGRSVAKGLGSRLRSQETRLVQLLAAGSGAGVAAGFNAPISGVFFAVETVLQRQRPSSKASSSSKSQGGPNGLTVAMVLLSAVLAAVVAAAGLGSSPAFRVPEYRLESLYELPLYLVFGALCGTISASFSFSTRVASKAFDEVRAQNQFEGALMPLVGGATTGVLALGYPEILYQGFDNVNALLFSAGSYAPGLLVQIVVMKIIATSICRGSGLQGGIYAPSIFIGAALGQAFGQVAHLLADPIGVDLSAPQAYALVGVAAMLASNCQVPLTSVLLLFELTRDYLILVPTLAAVGISFWVSSLAGVSLATPLSSASTAAVKPTAGDVALTAQQASMPPASEQGGAASSGTVGVEHMLDGVSSDPQVARQTVAAVLHQLEEVLHQSRLQRGKAGIISSSSSSNLSGINGAGGSSTATPELDSAAPARAAAAGSGRQPGEESWSQQGGGVLAAELAQPGSLAAVLAAAAEPVPALLLPVSMPPTEALAVMEAAGRGTAVVVGAGGSVEGVVTLQLLRHCLMGADSAMTLQAGAQGLQAQKQEPHTMSEDALSVGVTRGPVGGPGDS